MREILHQFTLWSALDVFVISVVIYYVLMLIKGTKSAQMMVGLIVFLLIFLASSFFPMTALYWILNKFYSSIFLIMIILFQDEIRQGLSQLGKKSLITPQETVSSQNFLDEVPRTVMALAQKKIGALIAVERQILLNRYVDIGTALDAKISKELLFSIFHQASPIHDGAVIIQKDRVSAAGCFLPLTRQTDLAQSMGTRHRAAIGLSEETDALVLLVSEEKGTVSIVVDGVLYPCSSDDDCRNLLIEYLADHSAYGFSKQDLEYLKIKKRSLGLRKKNQQ